MTVAAVFAAALFSSCTATYKTRTAKTVEISNSIIQMPTVVDLEVDTMVVKRDTVWTSTLFKNPGQPLKSQIKTVTAALLESAGADVLVQPSVSHDVTYHNIIKSTHTLSVSGFPARYGRFRTMTADDAAVIDILAGNKREQHTMIADYRTAIPQAPAAAGSIGKLSKPIKPVYKPKVKRQKVEDNNRSQRKTGYCGMVDIGGYVGLFESEGFRISTTHGYQAGKYFFVGGGLEYGYHTNVWVYDDYDGYTTEMSFLPIYLDLRAYFMNRRFSPYLEARLGCEVINAGLYFSAGPGFSIGHFQIGSAFNFSFIGDNGFFGFNITAGFKF